MDTENGMARAAAPLHSVAASVESLTNEIRSMLNGLRADLSRALSERDYYEKAYHQARSQTQTNLYCRQCHVIPVATSDGLQCWKCGARGDALRSWAALNEQLRELGL